MLVRRSSLATWKLMGTDPQCGGGDEDLSKEYKQSSKKREHSSDEEQGDRYGGIEPGEGTYEKGRDDGTDEKCGNGAKRDSPANEASTVSEQLHFRVNDIDRVGQARRQAVFERAAAIDDPGETVCEHHQHGADTRQKEDRRDRELDRVSDGDESDVLLHGITLC